ncbi:hypothetical protein KTJ89_11265 [Brevibacterium sediminis]|uniref:phage tail tube protein n=1 Tax=Brevibacterium sediminis TaxID=1857024 RepID=UPI002174D5D3|nr:hypothetical protein [Brevibacterium sediminis]MCS4593560.1 hypothetical protein [Brevibacterium sediminis]
MAEIPSTPADGNFKVVYVPAIADTKAPKLNELNADGALDISCYLTGDGWNPTKEQATISDPRMCSRQEFGRPGRKTPGLSITVIDNTNSDNEADANEAVETITEGAQGYFVERVGVPYEEEFAVGQKVSIYPATAGEKQLLAPEANSVTRSTIPQFIFADVQTDKPIVAAA